MYMQELEARKALREKLGELLPKEKVGELFQSIDRVLMASRYAREDGPYIAKPSMKISCGLKDIIMQRRPGGRVNWLLIDPSQEFIAAKFVSHDMREKEQFNELWELLVQQRDAYIEKIDPDGSERRKINEHLR